MNKGRSVAAVDKTGSGPRSRLGTELSRQALRLLAALAEPGAAATLDPTAEDEVFVAGSAGSAITLGRGRHRGQALRELAAADLAEPDGAGRHRISRAGAAHLARRSAAARSEPGPFRAQHLVLVQASPSPAERSGPTLVNAGESPLAWLGRRRDRDGSPFLDPAEVEAGERLRRDLTQGAILPSVTARWDGAVATGAAGPRDPAAATDAAIAARQRVRRALAAVGPDLADLLIDLCGFLKGLETIERDRAWPPRSGKVVIRIALRRLADHYGLAGEARGPERSRGIRVWSGEG
ncbi:MAG: ATPase [Methylobacteriaceae bacterium]|nr:ATPase [Methylobacteriaceae bacterium]